jgi:NADPH:quinone reductase-like Zn-dependent oxidoreductase
MPKAYVYTAFGGPEVEALADVARPVPGPGDILVAVRAAGVNPADSKARQGGGPQGAELTFPVVFGREVSGLIEELGEGVDPAEFPSGSAVLGSAPRGAFTEFAIVSTGQVAHKPESLSFAAAATLTAAVGSAYDAIAQLALPADATLIVTGAGGGVGTSAIQFALHRRLRVIGVASQAKREWVVGLGATHVEYGPGLVERIKAVAPDGVAGIFDLAGGETLAAVVPLLTDRGKLVSGAGRGAVTALGGSPIERPRTSERLQEVVDLVASGVIDPRVSAIYPFDQAGAALRAVESGHATGKVVLEIAH